METKANIDKTLFYMKICVCNIRWNNKPIYGNDSVHENNVSLHNDNFMFTSHIFGEWNKNTWNDQVADNFKRILDYIYPKYSINPVFMKDLL